MTNRVIKNMLITEKTLILAETENKYTFIVDTTTNKIEVSKAVAEKFDVKVLDVNIGNYLGKIKYFGKKRTAGKRSNFKKAVVTLKPGDTIKDFTIK